MRKPAPALGSPLDFTGYIRIIDVVNTPPPLPPPSEFIVDHVRAKHQKIHYYKGSNSINADPKQYQLSPVKDLSQHKPGPSRILSLEDEILMTLMRIRLDCTVEDLAFRFGVSVSLATNIITTFIVFLSLELTP